MLSLDSLRNEIYEELHPPNITNFKARFLLYKLYYAFFYSLEVYNYVSGFQS
jgi:hypothetical protein